MNTSWLILPKLSLLYMFSIQIQLNPRQRQHNFECIKQLASTALPAWRPCAKTTHSDNYNERIIVKPTIAEDVKSGRTFYSCNIVVSRACAAATHTNANISEFDNKTISGGYHQITINLNPLHDSSPKLLKEKET